MATQSAVTSTFDEPIENNDGVNLAEQETVSSAKNGENEEEKPKGEELPIQAISISERAVEDKQIESVEIKQSDDAPVVDVPIQDKLEMVKDAVPDSHTSSVIEPVADVVNSQSVALPAMKSIIKDAEANPAVTSMEKVQEEQPKAVDAPESSVESTENPREQSEVLPDKEPESVLVKDIEEPALSKKGDKAESLAPEVKANPKEQSEVIEQVENPESALVKDTEEPALSKEDDKAESSVPEVEANPKDQSDVIEQVEKPGSAEVIKDLQEPSEVTPVKELEAVVIKDVEDSAVSKEVDKVESSVPEVVLNPEQSEVIKQVEKPESAEAIEKSQEPWDSHLVRESEAIVLKNVEDSEAVPKEVDKPDTVIPQVAVNLEEQSEISKQVEKSETVAPQVEVKPEEQYEISRRVEKSETVISEVEVKPEEQSKITKQVEINLADGKPEPVVPDIEVKPEGPHEVSRQVEIKCEKVEPTVNIEGEPVKDEVTLAEKVEAEEEKNGTKREELGASSELAVSINQEDQAGLEHKKKETCGTDVDEVSSKAAVDMENFGEEKEAKTAKPEDENEERDLVNKEATEKSFGGEKISEGGEPVVENRQEETFALVEPSKDRNIGGKVDEASTAISELVKESQDSELEVKKEKSSETIEDKVEKEKDEIAKPAVKNLEPPIKYGDNTKTSQDLSREVPAKPTQKQSNNILTKVKQSLAKAKKAIIGKSPSSKTVSSDTRDDIKVK